MTSSRDVSVVEEALRVAAEHPDDLLTVVGPTASGKTALAVQLAERLGGEVVSADSVQIYREFDVGSGKPTAEELARAPHHLVGAIDPLEPIDAASWAARATAAVEDIRARGRVPIVCGGTFLWIKALLFGLAEAPSADPALREMHRDIAEREGREALHARLRAVDPESAARLHPNDLVRVSRALEVLELTGKPLSAWHREHAFGRVLHRATLVALSCDAATLTEHIRARVRAWLAGGWLDEVAGLIARGYGDARAMGSVGYSQVREVLAGEAPRDELETAIVRATRVFARRQRTWLNHSQVVWLGGGTTTPAARDDEGARGDQSSLGE
jgi:tRNA dimethylallyltransferase